MRKTKNFHKIVFIAIAVFCFISCKTERINLRTLAPSDSLVYLETNDLGEIASAFVKSKSWSNFAAEVPDYSVLSGVRAAVAVTGFSTNESDVSLNVKPKFVVILDTNSYERTTIAVVETQISKFLQDAKLEKSTKGNAAFLTWTTKDSRKITAAIIGNIAFIGNDEESVNRFLAVRSGEQPSLLQNASLIELAERRPLGFGFVSKNGVNEIAKFLSVRFAIESSEQDLVRSLITKIVPNVIDKSIEEITWSAKVAEDKIEDKFDVKLTSKVALNFRDSLQVSENVLNDSSEMIPTQFYSTTIYDLKSPNVAYQGLVRTITSETDEISGKIVENLSDAVLQSYGIRDKVRFFEAVTGNFVTAQLDKDGERSIVIVRVRDEQKLRSALVQDSSIGLKIVGSFAIFGEPESITDIALGGKNEFKSTVPASVTTFLAESDTAKIVIGSFSGLKANPEGASVFSTTRSNATSIGIERIRKSEFGLFGDILRMVKSG